MGDDYTSPFTKKPFEKKHLEASGRDIFSISVNAEERRMIDLYRSLWQCENDSTVLKALARTGAKVLQGLLDDETLRWLASPKRVRGSVTIPKTEPNVTQKEPVM